MSQIYDNNQFQELFGFNTTSTEISSDSLEIKNNLTLDYVNPNEVLITDATKKVISTNDLNIDSLTIPSDNTSDINNIDKALFFGNPSTNKVGFYSRNNLNLSTLVNNSIKTIFDASALYPNVDDGYNLGSPFKKFNAIFVNNIGNDVNIGTNKIQFTTGANSISGNGASNEIYIGTDSNDDRFVFDATSFYSTVGTTDIGKTTDYFDNAYISTVNSAVVNTTNSVNTVTSNSTTVNTTTVNTTTVNSTTTNCSNKLQFRENQTYISSANNNQLNFYTANISQLTIGNGQLYARNNITSLGANTVKWKELYVNGFGMMGEIRSNEYDSSATSGSDEALIEILGRKQFLRARSGGSPFLYSGFMCSYVDTSNFYIYSSANGNLKISYNALIAGVGSGYENATDCFDIDSSGNITAQGNLICVDINNTGDLSCVDINITGGLTAQGNITCNTLKLKGLDPIYYNITTTSLGFVFQTLNYEYTMTDTVFLSNNEANLGTSTDTFGTLYIDNIETNTLQKKSTQTPQFQAYIAEADMPRTEGIGSTDWEVFNSLGAVITFTQVVQFSQNASTALKGTFQYTGTETNRVFNIEYTVNLRKIGSGNKDISIALYKNMTQSGGVITGGIKIEQSQSRHQLATAAQSASFHSKVRITLSANDTISLAIKNATSSSNVAVYSYNLIVYDASEK